jgi:hypothetical protein
MHLGDSIGVQYIEEDDDINATDLLATALTPQLPRHQFQHEGQVYDCCCAALCASIWLTKNSDVSRNRPTQLFKHDCSERENEVDTLPVTHLSRNYL